MITRFSRYSFFILAIPILGILLPYLYQMATIEKMGKIQLFLARQQNLWVSILYESL